MPKMRITTGHGPETSQADRAEQGFHFSVVLQRLRQPVGGDEMSKVFITAVSLLALCACTARKAPRDRSIVRHEEKDAVCYTFAQYQSVAISCVQKEQAK
jgi:hypothetical protein